MNKNAFIPNYSIFVKHAFRDGEIVVTSLVYVHAFVGPSVCPNLSEP